MVYHIIYEYLERKEYYKEYVLLRMVYGKYMIRYNGKREERRYVPK